MVTYTKLFADILTSTIWAEASATRLVWITMLAMADRDGEVMASVPGLAHVARVSVEECEQALKVLGGPDHYSRTKDHDGRRIAEVRGGWKILNYEAHNERASAEDKRERDRLRQERKRERDEVSRSVTLCHTASREVTDSRESRLSSVPASVPLKKKRVAARPSDVSEEVWAEFVAHRGQRAIVTELVLTGLRREATAAALTLEQAMRTCVENGWRGFRADWLKSRTNGKHSKTSLIDGVRVVHPDRMPIPYDSPLGNCECESCKNARRRA